jgi:plastocyanin domain-containing protein
MQTAYTRSLSIATVIIFLVGVGCGRGSNAQDPVHVTVDKNGFTPSSLVLEKGEAGSTATITFTRTTDDTCARWVVAPDLKRNVPLPLDVPVTLSIPTDTERTLTFQCGVGALKGSLVVR